MIVPAFSGTPVDVKLGERAKLRSTHNHYLTFPVLFTMLSNHFPGTYGHALNWLVLTGEPRAEGGYVELPERPGFGWEVDRAASAVLREAGYAHQILHRTGHSLGESVHGNGVNMDDFETHDDRRLLPGSGFTIEPGVYFSDFGVRSEINMIVREHGAVVTGAVQTDILALG